MGVFTFPYFFFGKTQGFFLFFLMSLAIRGTVYFFFLYQEAKNRARRSKMNPKMTLLCQIDIRDLAILGV